ncbi:MAG: hypothetical protein H6729_12290 [Deltaproteobacteria bacterium]|nr:hypothetical protein [Deltaproteobacteria bacterium]
MIARKTVSWRPRLGGLRGLRPFATAVLVLCGCGMSAGCTTVAPCPTISTTMTTTSPAPAPAATVAPATAQASVEYKAMHTLGSLMVLLNSLHIGTPRHAVDAYLGEATYSPVEGQNYYATDAYMKADEGDREVPLGLVLDFRNKDGEVTERVTSIDFGPIAE